MNRNALAIIAAVAIGYLVLRPKMAGARVPTTGTQTGVGVTGTGQGSTASQPQSGTSKADAAVAGIGALGSLFGSLSGVLANKGGTDSKSTGFGGASQPTGGPLWSVGFDYRLDNKDTLDDSATDLQLNDRGLDDPTYADWDSSTGKIDVPDYQSTYASGGTGAATGEELGLGDYDLELDTSWWN